MKKIFVMEETNIFRSWCFCRDDQRVFSLHVGETGCGGGLHYFPGEKPRKIHLFPLSHLILLQAALRHGLVSLLLKGDDDQSHEYIDEEEGEHHEVDHIEDGCLHAKAWAGALILVGSIHRVLQDPEKKETRRR